MKRWLLAAAPLVGGLLVMLLFESLPGDPNTSYQLLSLVAKALAAAGALIGASQFDRGDYLRRAWGLIGLCYVLLFLNTLCFSLLLGSRGAHVIPEAEVARGVVTVVANVASIAGMVFVGRAWSVAGLELRLPRAVVVASMTLLLGVGVLMVGPSVWVDLQASAQADFSSLSSLASALGDVVSLAMAAPILLTAYALRGGTLAWPWSMNALSSLSWILYDSTDWAGDHLHLDPSKVLVALASIRVVACLFQLSAGLLQRTVMETAA